MRWLAALMLLCVPALSGAALSGASAQTAYPTKLVKIVVGFPAGSSVDILTRFYAQKLGDRFGQQFMVESRPGGAGNIAAESVIRSEPDGYTLYIGTVSNTIGTTLLKTLKFNFADDMAAVAQIAITPNILVVNKDLGVSTVDEFVALAKSKPGQIFYASSGIGSAPHMAGELFNLMTQAGLVHAPYKSNPPALMDLMGGRIASVFSTAPTAAPYIRDGRLRGLAVTSAKRASVVPDVPTMDEAGLKGYDTAIWFGVFAPKGTPEPILQMLGDALAQINTAPDMIAHLASNGAEPATMARAPFAAYVRAETKKWKDVIEAAKISAE
ncbi:MAG: tripartite tricarboxylate transporter substrate binding protein [Rhizobiales bacterium]|nr:tripartite tricarboxylate transporter substrate binding protein [Hyphomicrobiales bacterium]